METVFTVYGGEGTMVGALSAVLFIWVLLASGSAWIMGAGRAQAAACQDGGGPQRLGRISERTGVPVVMGLVSGAVSLATMVATLYITDGDGQRYFSAALTSAISMIIIAYLFVFPAFLAIRLRCPDLERPFRAPGGTSAAYAITILSTGWAVVATCCLLWPGFATSHPDAALPLGFEGQRLKFELLVLSPVVAVLAAVTLYHVVAHWIEAATRSTARL
jgi:amino acid transporter